MSSRTARATQRNPVWRKQNKTNKQTKKTVRGWRDGLIVKRYWLLFQRPLVQFPAPTWHLTTVYNSRVRELL
jgi:hypothetical protein